jgi:hypothetical protein
MRGGEAGAAAEAVARALPYCWAEQERRVHLQRFPCSLD